MNAVQLSTPVLALWLGLLAIKTHLIAAEPLDNYIGAWLFRDDRKQVWTGAEVPNNVGIVFYEQYIAICGPVKRLWTFISIATCKNTSGH